MLSGRSAVVSIQGISTGSQIKQKHSRGREMNFIGGALVFEECFIGKVPRRLMMSLVGVEAAVHLRQHESHSWRWKTILARRVRVKVYCGGQQKAIAIKKATAAREGKSKKQIKPRKTAALREER
jgi:hypothetical protein